MDSGTVVYQEMKVFPPTPLAHVLGIPRPMLKLSFRKRLGNFQLEIDHTITEKVTAFLGPSGSGKSTLLNCISGILNPDDGELLFSDQILYSSQQKRCLPPEKRRFGYVFQEGHLFPHLKVRQNISYGRPRRLDSGAQIDTDTIIDILEIGELLDRYPSQLSGGQRQRVAIARALGMSPRLLLMDEPLTSLDAGLKNRILPYLYHIKQAFDIPLLYVTHSISEVMALADEAFLLSEGRITARGEPHQLLASPFGVAHRPDDGRGEYSRFAGGRCVGGAWRDGVGVGGAEIDGFVYGDGARRNDADRYQGAGYYRCDGPRSADECAEYFARDNPGGCCPSGARDAISRY